MRSLDEIVKSPLLLNTMGENQTLKERDDAEEGMKKNPAQKERIQTEADKIICPRGGEFAGTRAERCPRNCSKERRKTLKKGKEETSREDQGSDD